MPTVPTGPATRAHRRTSLHRLQNANPNSTKPTFPVRFKAMGLGRRLLSLTFLSQQSFGYCPRAKRLRSNTGAGVIGDLFETAHNAIAPMWQPGAYVRSCELSSVVERTHSNLARKTKGWVEHEFHHAAENSRGIIAVPAARVLPECWVGQNGPLAGLKETRRVPARLTRIAFVAGKDSRIHQPATAMHTNVRFHQERSQ